MKSVKLFMIILPVLLAMSAFGPMWLWLVTLAAAIVFILSLWEVSRRVDKHPKHATVVR